MNPENSFKESEPKTELEQLQDRLNQLQWRKTSLEVGKATMAMQDIIDEEKVMKKEQDDIEQRMKKLEENK